MDAKGRLFFPADFRRQADAEVFSLDANGRFIVPRRFQALLGEERKTVFLGLDDRIELWDAARTVEPFLSAYDFTESFQQLMSTPL